MAAEGEFPKIDGDVLYASETNDFLSINIRNSISGMSNLTKDNNSYDFGDILACGTTTITTDNTDSSCINSYLENPSLKTVNLNAYIYETFDDFTSDLTGNVNWNVAVTGTGIRTVNWGILTLSSPANPGTVQVTSDGASMAFDFLAASGNSEVLVIVGTQSGTNKIQATNGTTTVDLVTVAANKVYRIVFDKGNTNAYVSTDNGAVGGAIDLSSVTTNGYLRLFHDGNEQGVQFNCVGFLDGDSGTLELVTETNTFKSTKSTCLPTWEYTGDDADVTCTVSADDGGNYEASTKDTFGAIVNTGVEGKIKLTIDLPESLSGTTLNGEFVKWVGGYYGS